MMEWIKKYSAKIPLSFIVIAIGVILFIPFLGNVPLFDWDEINFAEAAREMLLTKNYTQVTINFEPFWEKPPLFIWMQALSMHLFGINEMAARLPNAICGILTLLIIYKIGKRFINQKMAIIWVLLYAGSMLPHMYFKSGIIDPFFNLFIFLGIYFLSNLSYDLEMYDRKGRNAYKLKSIFLSGLFLGLAILTKGPVALLLTIITALVFFVIKKYKRIITVYELIIWIVVIALVSSLWFGFETYHRGTWFIKEFIVYQIRLMQTKDAGHGGFLFYHVVVILFGCFPASAFLLSSFKKNIQENENQKQWRWWMLCLFMTVLVVFTLVQTKIIHYSSMCYLPLTYLAALRLYYYIENESKIMLMEWVLFGLSGLVWLAILFLVPFAGMHIEWIKPLAIKDVFAYHNLDAKVYWSFIDYTPFVLAFIGISTAIFFLVKQNKALAVVLLLACNMMAISLCITLFVPKIEKYSQQSAIAFFEQHAASDASIEVFGYKSYAHYFYGKRKLSDKGLNFNKAIESTDKHTYYFICKLNKADYFSSKYPVKKLYEKNGFVFFQKINE